MNVNNLFDKNEYITAEDYLHKCGIENIDKYILGNYLEDDKHYDNIEMIKDIICLKNNKVVYNLIDCDVDGYMTSSILSIFLEELGYTVLPLLHKDKQHGLSEDIMEVLLKAEPSILWIGDAGTNNTEQCKQLSELGWKIIVTDHHQREKDNPYCILVNNQLSENVENKDGCGALVTWKVLHNINKKIANKLISYVMIATISDSMNVTSLENRTFLKYGKQMIHKNLMPFIDNLNKRCTNKDFSFGMITCLNSLIRLGKLKDKEELFYALCGKVETTEIIEKCKKYHVKQTEKTKDIIDSLEIDNTKNHIVVKLEETSPLTGLVANRLNSEYNKPCIVVARKKDVWMGSVRSPIEFKDIINNSELGCGMGHNNAFGVFIDDIDKMSDYISSLTLQKPCISVVTTLPLISIQDRLYSLFQPYNDLYGKGLDKPQFYITNIKFNSNDIIELKGNTLKIKTPNCDIMKFMASNKDKDNFMIGKNKKLEMNIIGELSINEWNGRKTNQIIINKYEIHEQKEISFEDLF